MNNEKTLPLGRLHLIDTLRGLALFSMILYHGAWDLVYLSGHDWSWYTALPGYLWQQSICWSFILLSGFCFPLGRHPQKRGLLIFGCGLLTTLATLLFMPENAVFFGILTLIGSCMLLLVLLKPLLALIPARAGLMGSFFLFLLCRNVNAGWLGFEGWRLFPLPDFLYANYATAYLGFPHPAFSSTDYFSLLPWFFLYLTGFYLFGLFRQAGWLPCLVSRKCPVLGWAGRQTLLLYLLHQPVLLLLLQLFHP